MRAVIVGPGVMGEALGAAWRRLHPEAELVFLGRSGPRTRLLAQRYQGRAAERVSDVPKADWLILTLKPQMAVRVLPSLRPLIQASTIGVSVMTGVSVGYLSEALGHSRWVRAMPNTPGQVGAGLTVWTGQGLEAASLQAAETLLAALGEVLWVEEESYLDMSTALSGTGPAYVFLFMEALIDAGVHMGLPRHLAERMVTATLRGSVGYYETSQKAIATLRHEVTSPGGTTAEAMYHLEKAGFRPAISRAVWAAYQRALALRPAVSLSPNTAEAAQ